MKDAAKDRYGRADGVIDTEDIRPRLDSSGNGGEIPGQVAQ